MLGHDGPPQGYWRENLLSGAPLACCPVRSIERAANDTPALTREVLRYVDVYYPAYRDHHLLVAGGLADQPARYLELIGLVRSVDSRVQARRLEIQAENADD